MIFGISFGSLVIIIIAIYLVCIAPNTGRAERLKPFEEKFIAHRGLYDNHTDSPENSLNAFSLAESKGYGIELDVQFTLDNLPVIFHDDDLKRVCGVDKKISELNCAELKNYKLFNSGQTIPLFSEFIQRIKTDTPLVIEIKDCPNFQPKLEILVKMLDEFKGVFCIESFNPLILEWLKNNRPNYLRGQLATDFFEDLPSMSFDRKFLLTNLLLNFKSKPDFIAYNHKHQNQFSFRLVKGIFGIKSAGWTIKNKEQLDSAKELFNIYIFDDFEPKK